MKKEDEKLKRKRSKFYGKFFFLGFLGMLLLIYKRGCWYERRGSWWGDCYGSSGGVCYFRKK